MAGHQRPLGLQWGAASCSPSDDSEVVVGSLGDGLGSVNLRTGELVASWRGAAAAPADAAVELKFWEADGRGGFAAAAVVRGPHGAGVSVGAVGFHQRFVCLTAAPTGSAWVELDGAAGRWTCALTVAHCAGHGPPRQLCWSPDGSLGRVPPRRRARGLGPGVGRSSRRSARPTPPRRRSPPVSSPRPTARCAWPASTRLRSRATSSPPPAPTTRPPTTLPPTTPARWRYSAKAKAAAVSGDRVVVAVPLEPPAAAVLVFAADDAAPLFAWDVVAVPALALSGAGGVLAAFPDGALLHLATEAPAAAPTVAVAPRRWRRGVVEAGDGPPSPSAALAFDALLRVDPARGADLDAPDTASGVCELLLAGAYY
ncbi:hypothetical protein SO694_00026119 [Aureococcus anophagefferens]|uniref:Anaphase-promoting complex subunit 4 WD40 domain-containing protein n=1 Tax=Aureococcus anophagefferens TaxID=44056 RepID=A0ABR1FUJ4_AURAN